MDEREIVFTSGGTESINWVLHSNSLPSDGSAHYITTGLEHCAVNNYIKDLSNTRNNLTYSIVNPREGTYHVDPNDIMSKVNENTGLICVMLGWFLNYF